MSGIKKYRLLITWSVINVGVSVSLTFQWKMANLVSLGRWFLEGVGSGFERYLAPDLLDSNLARR